MPGLIDEVIERLQAEPLAQKVRIINYDETPAGKLEAKIRCQLIRNHHLQIWLHHEAGFQDYAFQLFTNRPL